MKKATKAIEQKDLMKRIWAFKSTIGFHLQIHAKFLSYISKVVCIHFLQTR